MSYKIFETITTQRFVPYSFDPYFLDALTGHAGMIVNINLKFNNGIVAEGDVVAEKNLVALLDKHNSLLHSAETNTNWVLASLSDGTIIYYGADRIQDAAEQVAKNNGWTTEDALIFLQLSNPRSNEDAYDPVGEDYWSLNKMLVV